MMNDLVVDLPFSLVLVSVARVRRARLSTAASYDGWYVVGSAYGLGYCSEALVGCTGVPVEA